MPLSMPRILPAPPGQARGAITSPHLDHIAAFRAESLVAGKILVEKRAYGTLFYHQKKVSKIF